MTSPIMSERRVSMIGALLVAIGPVSMALYTPAMTELVRVFETTESAIKLTLTLYFGGFACAQLIAGPLSDALGRRPITIAFMALYCVASVAATLSPTVEVLMGARFLQGIGASAGIAISRALVRDLFTDDQSSRIMNLIGIILALGPALAPTIGGLMLPLFGWQSIFLLMTLIGFLVIWVALFSMKETVTADPSRLNFKALGRTYKSLLGNPQFMTAALVMGGALGALYAQATFLPFILMDEVGLTPAQFGASMLAQSGSFFAASLLVRQLMGRFSANRLVGPGLVFVALGSLGTLTLLLWPPSFLHVMVPVATYSFGIAFVMPAMSTAALAPFGRSAGAAASMLGFIQMGSGLLVGSIGAMMGNALLAMAILIPMMGAMACISFLIYRKLQPPASPTGPAATRATCGPKVAAQAPVTAPEK
ncbi:MAG: multidrug effflux MFS transporter [Sulfitobacter litoralis]|jgi:DHA1 family bicyclomycin/chloramphenicol resistance-like MFS transporter|uniref:multidrug effflux MFS transporter n=1 Tax=Sulfitobacter TaxID=60136 RepID=UPI001B4C68C1|nr:MULTISPECIES: multidrug effflux MFS transporter [Sulfitobacter]MBQ0767570.1 multidrug effflux MFS transporter [Sulfitobacter litoralis]MCF7728288.1 Bcr/CflA family efflux MFS transporter [Sulfitobacter sp. M22]MCF7779277.1 Bcr/CflA family efflux MFS transporter [Sulfitobacter sp. M220]